MPASDYEDRLRLIAGALILTGVLLVLTTGVDYLAGIWPYRPSAVEWRYGSVGLAGGFLLTPLLGVALLLLAGAIGGSRLALWATFLVAVTITIALVVLSGLFVLDALQVRASVAAEMKGPFLFGVGKALFKLLTGALGFLMLGIAARHVLRSVASLPQGPKGKGTLVVGK